MPVRVICTTSSSIRRTRTFPPPTSRPFSTTTAFTARPSEQNTTLAVGTPLISIVKSSTSIIRCQRAAGRRAGNLKDDSVRRSISLASVGSVFPVDVSVFLCLAWLFATLQIGLQHVAECQQTSITVCAPTVGLLREQSNDIPLRQATARNDNKILLLSSSRQISVTVKLFYLFTAAMQQVRFAPSSLQILQER